MKFLIGVLTRNAVSTLRWSLFERTVSTLRNAFSVAPLFVLDNDSDDGSDESVRQLDTSRILYHSADGNTSPGRGRNELMKMFGKNWSHALDSIVVLSDDDVQWHYTAEHRLREFWSHAPEDIAILSCLLEPDWPWNTPRELIECGRVKALIRDSAPAAAWTFRLRDWDKIGPLKESLDGDGEDFDACKRLAAQGLRVAQIDLAEHHGDGYSQIGNDQARKTAGRPLDRKKWGL